MGCGRARDDNWLMCSVLGRNKLAAERKKLNQGHAAAGGRRQECRESRSIGSAAGQRMHNVPGLLLPCRCLGVCDLPIEALWNNL